MHKHVLLLVSAVLACEGGTDVDTLAPGAERLPIEAEDLVDESGKADGSIFDHALIMSDALFEDTAYLTAAQVQAFFERTPYDGRRCFLADTVEAGLPVSQHLVNIASEFRINPLVLLVKLQVESSIIAAAKAPSSRLIQVAMGCGCLDGDPTCAAGEKGLVPQLRCAARVFRWYLDDLAAKGQTISGWKVGSAKKTSEGISLRPGNRATAALYTYTPWVLEGTGGNWLFWNVLQKFVRQFSALSPNKGWIGGTCSADASCAYLEPICLAGAGPAPFCTKACDRYCPDSTDPGTSGTFCADLGAAMTGIPGGFCLSRCDSALHPATGGCAVGFTCERAERFGEPGVFKDVCWPGQ